MTFELHNEDNLAVLRRMPDNSIDAVVTDPPYGLGKEPDALAMLRDWLETGHHEVKGKGFMGKSWDAFVPQPAQWREVYRVLKPGGHVLTFAGTRTQDLVALGLRLAAFEIRDLVAWLYGSGFPKNLDVSKAIDKDAGEKGTFGEPKSEAHAGWIKRGKMRGTDGHEGYQRPWMEDPQTVSDNARQYIPATAAAAEWQGWGTALKPALEPITLARKPLIGTVAQNVLKWHTGGINVDGCRVEHVTVDGGSLATNPHLRDTINGGNGGHIITTEKARRVVVPNTGGRFPANVIHDGSDEVVGLFPVTTSGKAVVGTGRDGNHTKGIYGAKASKIASCFADTGSAARFFYCAKTNSTDRNEGCADLPDKDWQGENTCIPERENRPFNPSKNDHPTVKPTALMRYLCRLITPPSGTVLDPWMGSGSTGKACAEEGFSFIGIDSDTTHGYFRIAQARVSAAYEKHQPDDWI